MTRAAIFAAVLFSFSSPLLAQREMSQAEYQKMMEQAMKSGSYSQSQAQSWDARLRVLSGTVMVRTVDKEEWSKVAGEMPLDPNDSVKTGADGQAEILLDDKGVVSLTRNTEVEVSSLEQEDAVLSLNLGAIVAKVKHFLNDKHRFQVRTPSAVCAIRGTEFAVEHSVLSKESAFGVFDEGKIEVSLPSEGGKPPQEFMLEKNSEIVINPARKRFKVVQLFRMGRHRSVMGKVRKRLSALKGWRPASAERRALLRENALKGKVIRKQIKSRAGKARKSRATRKAR